MKPFFVSMMIIFTASAFAAGNSIRVEGAAYLRTKPFETGVYKLTIQKSVDNFRDIMMLKKKCVDLQDEVNKEYPDNQIDVISMAGEEIIALCNLNYQL